MTRNSQLYIVLLALVARHLLLAKADVDVESQKEHVLSVLREIEEVAKDVRDKIESAYKQRCDPDTLDGCGNKNYNDCSSEFPNPTCSCKSTSDCKYGREYDV
jgi:hypothetical protein